MTGGVFAGETITGSGIVSVGNVNFASRSPTTSARFAIIRQEKVRLLVPPCISRTVKPDGLFPVT